jgi:hypothetical protein
MVLQRFKKILPKLRQRKNNLRNLSQYSRRDFPVYLPALVADGAVAQQNVEVPEVNGACWLKRFETVRFVAL